MRVSALSPLAFPWLFLALAAAPVVAQDGAVAPTASQYDVEIQGQSADTAQPQSQSGSQSGSESGSRPGTTPEAESVAMPPAPPADALDAVRLSDVEGAAQLIDSSGKIVEQARINMTVLPGMRVQTGNDGRAELQFPDGAVARVTPNSALVLTAVHRDADSDKVVVGLRAAGGLTYYEVPAKSQTDYAVQVGKLTASADPNGAGGQATLLRVNLDAAPYEAAVLSGAVHLADAEGNISYDLSSNQSTTIDPASASNYDVAQSIVPDTWDTWNTDRDAALAQIAGGQNSNGEPNGPGWSDLDYYGSWYNIPGEGMAWAPDGVDQNFDPYGSGAWSYSAAAGYTWASAYPWGWLPYHCGLWNYQGGYGWMWLPSSCGWGYGGGAWFPYSEARGLGGYHLPLRPVPARGIVHTPPAYPVVPVHRGVPVRFRAVGSPRPVIRPAVVAGETLQPVPAEVRPSYAPAGSLGYMGGGMRTSQGNLGARGSLRRGEPVYGFGPRIATPGQVPHYEAPSLQRSSPPSMPPSMPRYSAPAPPSAPAPRYSPPPAPSMPAPHMVAPAPAAPAGHH